MITLLTKDGKRTGNAIIIGGEDDDPEYIFHVETDFGNRIKITAEELNEMFTLGRVCSYEEWDAARIRSRVGQTRSRIEAILKDDPT